MSQALIQALVSGLAIGSIYALVALGFSITFTTTKTLNFSHGEFVSAGAFVYITGLLLLSGSRLGETVVQLLANAWIYGISLLVTAVVMGILGVILYRVGIRPFAGKPGLAWVVSTLGVGVVLQSIGLAIWGPSAVVLQSPIGDGMVELFGANIRTQEVLVIVVACVIMVLMDWLMRRTMLGKVMRAVAHNGPNASLMGINVGATMAWAFVVSSALAGLSGILIAPIATASIFMGLGFGLKGFSAAMVGGLTNPRGCVLGGIVLGILESVINLWQAQLREIFIFLMVILVLSFRPTGLFGRKVIEKT